MDVRFEANNTHLENAATFSETDPHLRRLYKEPYVYRSSLIDEFPLEPGILTLGGGRQIGKTTLLKQWMEMLLTKGIQPEAICFYSGELISDYQALYLLVKNQLNQMPQASLKYLILDEITYIKDWDKAIKYLADTGEFENTVVILSGSDLVLMQDARIRFPGRRGKAPKVDFHYYPLSFREFIQLKNLLPTPEQLNHTVDQEVLTQLYQQLDAYLMHGGFLSAINDYEKHQKILTATLATYSDWIRGDILKRNKKEVFLNEIIGAVIKYYNKQVSWDNLVKELSIDHTQTVADYISLLCSMDAVFVQAALIEDKLKAAPKKRKKLMFCDPFIYHAMKAWLKPCNDPYNEQMTKIITDPIAYSELVEACVTTHFRRYYPTYYIKAEGEVDIAYVKDKRFWPIEIKWSKQLRPKDLKQISKYPHGKIYAKTFSYTDINNIPVIPLPIALLNIPEFTYE